MSKIFKLITSGSTGEKPFQCFICGRKFRQAIHLKRHDTAIHRQDPYQCSICKQECTSSYRLYKHSKTHCFDEMTKS